MLNTLRTHIEKLVPLTDEEFTLVSSYFTAKKYKKHQFLIQEGEDVHYNYFVVKGLLKLVYTDESLKEYIVGFAMEDWWESDFQAFYTKTKATMSLECVEDTEVLCLQLDDYRKLCAALPKIEHFFLEKASFGFIAAQQRIISTMTSSIKERYNQLLEKHPSLIQRVPKSLLAAYLGVSRETLSRLSP
ncbi:Crp/Fnr family transcriptional regulator [Chryseobacterium sp. ERMR1:04]|uniref:Crp/Fnr family transcriptional regulator n=1 Tax=Chryseobacterium sp. ERMR1:04 TaxID=1705393 RepID=UPI0006C8CBDA|nr:Crp/Fnr family transcriptional regulator [Chryseobacterium sp. ERMR1:04]KPH13208.1 Crp/Fnr family transcriptional regulator [Chryseobacterium sp. ERMR1:04]